MSGGSGTEKAAVIAGGGIGGILAALLLRRANWNVTLVERAEQIGGLLRSTEGPGHFMYDSGVHFALDTGVAEIDEVVLSGLQNSGWRVFSESLREGHVFRNGLDSLSGCIDARSLPKPFFLQGLAELISSEQPAAGVRNLAEELGAQYGGTFRDQIFGPALEKITGSPLEDLAPGTHRLFSLERLIVAGREASKDLKRSPSLDARIAFRSFEDGQSSMRKFYPRRGGVGLWVVALEEQLRREGVNIETGAQIASISKPGDRIVSVTTSLDEKLDCDLLVWTVPSAFLLGAAGFENPKPPKQAITINLYHFLYETAVASDLHWITDYNPDHLTYRITLYPNIMSEKSGPPPHHLTVEVLSHSDFEPEQHADRIHDELCEIGVIPAGTGRTGQSVEVIRNAIPVPTIDFAADQDRINGIAASFASNFLPLGRASGSHFQVEIMRSVYAGLVGHGALQQASAR